MVSVDFINKLHVLVYKSGAFWQNRVSRQIAEIELLMLHNTSAQSACIGVKRNEKCRVITEKISIFI